MYDSRMYATNYKGCDSTSPFIRGDAVKGNIAYMFELSLIVYHPSCPTPNLPLS